MSTIDRTPYVTITVPGTSGVDQLIPREELHRRALTAAKALSAMYGGATMREGSGTYVARDGGLIVEPVVEVTAYVLDMAALPGRDRKVLRAMSAEWAAQWGQECVLLNLSGSVELIDPLPAA